MNLIAVLRNSKRPTLLVDKSLCQVEGSRELILHLCFIQISVHDIKSMCQMSYIMFHMLKERKLCFVERVCL